MRSAILAAVSLFGLVASAVADDVYVSNVSGDDRFDGRSVQRGANYSGPVRTIAKALRVAGPDDRIVLDNTGQPYHEGVSLEGPYHSGRAGHPFVIQGNGAVLDGLTPTPPEAWEQYRDDIYRFYPERLHYQEFFLGDKPAVRRTSVSDRSLTELQPREWFMGTGHIYFRTDAGAMPQEYRPWHAIEPTGITLYQVHDVAILNLDVRGFQIDGINAHDNVRGLLLAGVVCRSNGRSGVAICGASQADISGCLLGGNGQAQLHVEGQSETHLQNCQLLTDTAPATERLGNSRLFVHDSQ